MYFNYEKFFSIVLMAVVNANYEFILVDIGDYGRHSDGSVFLSSNIGYSIINKLFNLPPPKKLRGTDKMYPYVFVGDDAFPLRQNLIKTYSKCQLGEEKIIANYQNSRAKKIGKNEFGVATSYF